MRIQNDAIQRQYSAPVRANNGAGTVPPEFQQYFDNYYNSLQKPGGTGLLNPMANAPQNVKDVWEQTKEELGTDGSAAAPDGRLTHISGYILTRLEQQFQTGSGDMFGSTVNSAISGAQKILDRLNNPLSPPHSAEVAKNQDREKLFYQKFIENLTQKATPPPHEYRA